MAVLIFIKMFIHVTVTNKHNLCISHLFYQTLVLVTV